MNKLAYWQMKKTLLEKIWRLADENRSLRASIKQATQGHDYTFCEDAALPLVLHVWTDFISRYLSFIRSWMDGSFFTSKQRNFKPNNPRTKKNVQLYGTTFTFEIIVSLHAPVSLARATRKGFSVTFSAVRLPKISCLRIPTLEDVSGCMKRYRRNKAQRSKKSPFKMVLPVCSTAQSHNTILYRNVRIYHTQIACSSCTSTSVPTWIC